MPENNVKYAGSCVHNHVIVVTRETRKSPMMRMYFGTAGERLRHADHSIPLGAKIGLGRVVRTDTCDMAAAVEGSFGTDGNFMCTQALIHVAGSRSHALVSLDPHEYMFQNGILTILNGVWNQRS